MRKLLVLLATGWVGVNLAAAWVSYDRRLPHHIDGLDRTGAPGRIGEDWLLGWGSGLAVPLWFIAIGAVVAVLATLDGAAGRGGALLLAVVGALSVAFTLFSRHAVDLLSDPAGDARVASLVVASVTLAALTALVGLVSFVTAPRDRLR